MLRPAKEWAIQESTRAITVVACADSCSQEELFKKEGAIRPNVFDVGKDTLEISTSGTT